LAKFAANTGLTINNRNFRVFNFQNFFGAKRRTNIAAFAPCGVNFDVRHHYKRLPS